LLFEDKKNGSQEYGGSCFFEDNQKLRGVRNQ